jgi:transposase
MPPPNPYYDVMRESSSPNRLRLRMVQYAKEEGVKPAARVFSTSPQTVRKWLRRFDGTLASLNDRSRAPIHRPNKLPPSAEAEILRAKKKAPCLGARRLRAEMELPYSAKAITRVLREHGLLRPRRRRKHETKKLLREVKKKWRLWQQIDVDAKDLCDIPEYWMQREALGLPRYQYTARDVTTGLVFMAFAHELSLLHSHVFVELIITHLISCGVDLSETTWQSDNGSEFVGSWQAKGPSAVTRLIESVPGQRHKTIPPRAHRFQADVETVHNLVELEFYETEKFRSRDELLKKARAYVSYFNTVRRNSGKEMKTPWELLFERAPRTPKQVALLAPVILDELAEAQVTGKDLRSLP